MASLSLAATLLAQGTPMLHREATVNGVKLHYVQSGAGPLILFLHGFPEFWYAWKNQLEEFGKDHLAVAPDQRGYNLSAKPGPVEAYRVPDLIEDVRALAASLNGGRPFVLVGHDWGGAIAWAFAIKHPELLTKLVIINAPHPGVFDRELTENPAQQKASQYMLFFRSAGAEAALAANGYATLLRFFEAPRKLGKFLPEDDRAYVAAWSQPGALTGGLNYYRASRIGPPTVGTPSRPSEAAQLPSLMVTTPTLVIWGERDEALLTGNLLGLEQYVPRLTIKRIPEGSHWVVHEFPTEVNGLIREFLRAP
ncbi:MAG: alpha/beta fold hydrolase [Gemmatimonadales bacterium]